MKHTLYHANQWLEWDWKVPPLITAWAPYEHILTVIATNLKGQNLMVLYAQCIYKTVILWDLNQMITIIRSCPCGVIFANLERDLLVSPWPTDWHEIPFTIPKKKKKTLIGMKWYGPHDKVLNLCWTFLWPNIEKVSWSTDHDNISLSKWFWWLISNGHAHFHKQKKKKWYCFTNCNKWTNKTLVIWTQLTI